jgi:hypothetical protein
MELTRENVDTIFLRDWFVDDYDIYEILIMMDDEVYDWVYENRERYSERVRMCIEPTEYIPDAPLPKLNDLTDFDLFRIEKKKRELLELGWIKYKSENVLERPDTTCDHDLDTNYLLLTNLRKELKVLDDKFVSPSLRHKISDSKKDLLAKITFIENEYKSSIEKVKQEDVRWEQQQKEEWIQNQSML